MLELIRDAAWQFILGFSGIAVTILLFREQKQQSKKELSFRIVSIAPIVSVTQGISQQLQVTFNGVQIKNAFVAILNITNSGKTPITPPEYYEPITISTGGSEILSVELVETLPLGINTQISHTKNSFVLTPVLLNHGDILVLRLLASDLSELDLKVNARIVDVKEIKFYGEYQFEQDLLAENTKIIMRRRQQMLILYLFTFFIVSIFVLYLFFTPILAS